MTSSLDKPFDVVVVGGGTAGCVAAARASENSSRRVLLVEEGPDPLPIPDVVLDPKRQPELILQSPYVRMYEVDREDGSTFPLLSGRIMGGGSSVNNLAAVRPMRWDFDAWRRFGGDAWSYEALLPVMRDVESDPDFPASPLHGSSGPLRVRRQFDVNGPADPPVRALIDAATSIGLPLCPDLNVPEPYGVCSSPYNVDDAGRRLSTAIAYLDPARDRPNLTILPDTTATRVVLEGGRACGAEVVVRGEKRLVEAGLVVVAAGVFHSPQLLMLSGIGPPPTLERVGVPVAHPLEGVGANYQDHAVAYVTFLGETELREDYVIPKVRLIAKSDPDREVPDLHVFMRPSVRVEGSTPMLPVSVHLLEHRSPGRVSIASADPTDLPAVDPALVRDPADVRALVDGVRFVLGLTGEPVLRRFYGPLIAPASEDDLEAHVRTTYDTYHHGVGTCRFGPAGDPGAVVDPSLRVHGIDGLMVADASVLPTVPHANTNLAAILVGEIAARQIAVA